MSAPAPVFADEADFPLHGPWEAPGEVAAALVVAVDGLGRVLLQLRDDAPHVPNGGVWAPFGGGVEPGETLRAAALREFEEETGVLLRPGDLLPLGRAISPARRRARLYVFLAAFPGGPEAIRVGEGAGFAFLTPAQVLRMHVAPALRGMIVAAPDMLARGARAG